MATLWGRRLSAAVATVVLGLGPTAATGLPESIRGPIEAKVVAVIDGDTLLVRARPWVGLEVETRVRLLGIDTPELKGKCDAERQKAEAARTFLEKAVGEGLVLLHDVRHDKYGGRVLAHVRTAAGQDCAQVLVAAGLARPYDGRRREDWCEG